MNNEIPRSGPPNNAQKELLVEFIRNHPELQSGHFTATFTKKMGQKLWQEIAVILNSIPNGANKCWIKWRKTWQDQKKHTKSKLSKNKAHSNETGGGASDEMTLSEYENDVASFINPLTVKGDLSVIEADMSFAFGDSDNTATLSRESVKKDHPDTLNTIHTPTGENMDGQSLTATENQPATDDRADTVSYNQPRTPRLNKIKRLTKSVEVADKLVATSSDRNNIMKEYYKKKNEILERSRIDRRNYERRKLKLLVEKNKIQTKILCKLQSISNLLQSNKGA